jgi:hypothetical protein
MSKKLSKYLLFFILCVTIGISAFYSAEGFDTYTMKTALINTDTNNGKMYTIDTDGNFNEQINNVAVSAMGANASSSAASGGGSGVVVKANSVNINTTSPATTHPAAPLPPIFANSNGTQGLV